MKGAAEGEPHEKQRSEIQIQRLEIQIQKFERRSRGGSHIPILASVSIRPTAHTPNYFPHSISLNTNTSTRKTGKYKYKYEKIWLKLGLWFGMLLPFGRESQVRMRALEKDR